MLYIQSNVNKLLKSWNLNILLLSYFLAYEIYSKVGRIRNLLLQKNSCSLEYQVAFQHSTYVFELKILMRIKIHMF